MYKNDARCPFILFSNGRYKITVKSYFRSSGSQLIKKEINGKKMTINHNLLQIRQWLVKVMKLFRQGNGIVGCLPVFLR